MTGVGGGALMTPLLVTIASVGAGAVGVTAIMLLMLALATSCIVGSHISHRLPERALRGFLATLLVLIGGKLAL